MLSQISKENNLVVLKFSLFTRKQKKGLTLHKGSSHTMWQLNVDQTEIESVLLLFLNLLTDATVMATASDEKLCQHQQ